MKVSQRPEAEGTHLQAGPTETLWWNQNAMVYFMLCLNWITGHIGDIPIYPIFRHGRIAKIPSSHIKVLRVGPNCSIGTLQWQLISATSADQLQILRNVHSHISDDVWDTVSGQDSGRYLLKCVLFFEVACVFMNPLTFSSPAGNYFLVWFGKSQGLRIGVRRAVCLWTTSANGFPFSSWFTGTLPSLQIEVPVGIGDENSPAWAPRSE